MKTIEVSDENYAALDDRLGPDLKTIDDVISGELAFTDALVEQNAKLKARAALLEAVAQATAEWMAERDRCYAADKPGTPMSAYVQFSKKVDESRERCRKALAALEAP